MLCFNKYNITYYTTVNVILCMRPFDNFSFTTGLRDIYIYIKHPNTAKMQSLSTC